MLRPAGPAGKPLCVGGVWLTATLPSLTVTMRFSSVCSTAKMVPTARTTVPAEVTQNGLCGSLATRNKARPRSSVRWRSVLLSATRTWVSGPRLTVLPSANITSRRSARSVDRMLSLVGNPNQLATSTAATMPAAMAKRRGRLAFLAGAGAARVSSVGVGGVSLTILLSGCSSVPPGMSAQDSKERNVSSTWAMRRISAIWRGDSRNQTVNSRRSVSLTSAGGRFPSSVHQRAASSVARSLRSLTSMAQAPVDLTFNSPRSLRKLFSKSRRTIRSVSPS